MYLSTPSSHARSAFCIRLLSAVREFYLTLHINHVHLLLSVLRSVRNADQMLCNIPYLVSRKVQNLLVLNTCFKILIYNKQFLIIMQCTFRSSRPEMLCKKGVFKNFAKFIGKHLRRVSFLIKLRDSDTGVLQ